VLGRQLRSNRFAKSNYEDFFTISKIFAPMTRIAMGKSFKIGHSSKAFGYVENWLTKEIGRYLMKGRRWKVRMEGMEYAGAMLKYNIFSDLK
jgi:hypothetical protein